MAVNAFQKKIDDEFESLKEIDLTKPEQTDEEKETERLAAEKKTAQEAEAKKGLSSTGADPDGEKKSSDTSEVDTLKAQLQKVTQDYNSIKGMWDKFGRDTHEIKELRQEVANLKKQLEEAAKPEPKPEPKIEDDPEYVVLEKDLGAAAAKIILEQRKELQALKGEIGGTKEEIKATKEKTGKIEEYQAATASMSYAEAISTAIPDWDDLMGTEDVGFSNQNPKFTNYLQQTNFGKTNLQWVQEFHAQGNVQEVKRLFDTGRAYAGVAPAGKADTEAKTDEKKTSKADEYIEPGKTVASTEKTSTDTKRTYTKKERDEFDKKYMHYQAHPEKYKGAETKIEAMWNDIIDAAGEGRWVG